MGAGGSPSPSGCSEQGLRPSGELAVAQPQHQGADNWRELDLRPAPLVRPPFIICIFYFHKITGFLLIFVKPN